jgi:hypothetical protein
MMTKKEWIRKDEILKFLVKKPVLISKNFLDNDIIEIHIKQEYYNDMIKRLTIRKVKQ